MASILIVDDSADERDALCRFLMQAGYTVECVPNGREALASILARTPDLIVFDLLMPEMDGAGLLEVVRSYLRLQSVPVILWTGAADSPMLERARHLRVNAIMIKPKATFDEIRQAIDQELHRAPN